MYIFRLFVLIKCLDIHIWWLIKNSWKFWGFALAPDEQLNISQFQNLLSYYHPKIIRNTECPYGGYPQMTSTIFKAGGGVINWGKQMLTGMKKTGDVREEWYKIWGKTYDDTYGWPQVSH